MKTDRKLFEIILLLIIASFVIFYKFNEVPKKLSQDEVAFARLAISLDKHPYISYSREATGHSTLYFYFILASFKIFGENNFALRFPAALFGLFAVLLLYLVLSRIDFSKFVKLKNKFLNQKLIFFAPIVISLFPFIISFLFLSTRWFFNFARFSFEVTFLITLELLSIFFFFWFKENKKTLSLLFSSLFAGLAFHSYYPGRIFFILPLIFLFLEKSKNRLKYILLYLLILFFVTLPLTTYLVFNPDIRVGQQLYILNPDVSIVQKIMITGLNTIKLFFMFNFWGDLNGRHNYPGKPIFNPVQIAFLTTGFIYLILNLKKNFYNQFFLSYFILSLIPALLTYSLENPNLLRTMTALLPVVYFTGLGIFFLINSRINSKIIFIINLLIILLLFFASFLYDVRSYFRYQPKVFDSAFEVNGRLKRILDLNLWEKTGLF